MFSLRNDVHKRKTCSSLELGNMNLVIILLFAESESSLDCASFGSITVNTQALVHQLATTS